MEDSGTNDVRVLKRQERLDEFRLTIEAARLARVNQVPANSLRNVPACMLKNDLLARVHSQTLSSI